jgi:hypothetical protein
MQSSRARDWSSILAKGLIDLWAKSRTSQISHGLIANYTVDQGKAIIPSGWIQIQMNQRECTPLQEVIGQCLGSSSSNEESLVMSI